ncbi:MAG: ABC-2 transporter permease [Lachnospiraceae bacterium]|nr:ABC-2 transporter permease [Lachnospiraceae bacterium]
MRAIKFTIIDMLRCKITLFILLVFSVIAFFFIRESLFFGFLYLCFGGIIASIQPFAQEQQAESGFINMLPATKGDRILGRYLFGLFLLLFSMVLASLVAIVYGVIHPASHENWSLLIIGFLGGGLIMISLQYLLFYVLGKMKSQQFQGFIMMLPGFIFFFGINFLMEEYRELVPAIAAWISSHMNLFVLLLLLAGFVTFGVCSFVSTLIANRRDSL